jgi:hypothetical protein
MFVIQQIRAAQRNNMHPLGSVPQFGNLCIAYISSNFAFGSLKILTAKSELNENCTSH